MVLCQLSGSASVSARRAAEQSSWRTGRRRAHRQAPEGADRLGLGHARLERRAGGQPAPADELCELDHVLVALDTACDTSPPPSGTTSTVKRRPSRCTFKVIPPEPGLRTSAPEDSLLRRTVERPRSTGPLLRHERSGLDRLYVRRVRALGPVGGVVADLRALGERLEAVAGDAGVVHEEVLALIVGRDE